MNKTSAWIVSAAIGLFAAGPVFAASGDACLQNDRIWGWQAVDARTLVVTDTARKPFTVHISGGCVGLTNVTNKLSFLGWDNLSCLERGDRISFREPTLGRMSCFVEDVQPGLPPKSSKDKAPAG